MANKNYSPKLFGIATRTRRIKAEVLISEAARHDTHLRQSLYAVQYALQTGRVNGEVDLSVQRLSGYRYAKLICEAANVGLMGNDAAQFLNERYAVTKWQPSLL